MMFRAKWIMAQCCIVIPLTDDVIWFTVCTQKEKMGTFPVWSLAQGTHGPCALDLFFLSDNCFTELLKRWNNTIHHYLYTQYILLDVILKKVFFKNGPLLLLQLFKCTYWTYINFRVGQENLKYLRFIYTKHLGNYTF